MCFITNSVKVGVVDGCAEHSSLMTKSGVHVVFQTNTWCWILTTTRLFSSTFHFHNPYNILPFVSEEKVETLQNIVSEILQNDSVWRFVSVCSDNVLLPKFTYNIRKAFFILFFLPDCIQVFLVKFNKHGRLPKDFLKSSFSRGCKAVEFKSRPPGLQHLRARASYSPQAEVFLPGRQTA